MRRKLLNYGYDPTKTAHEFETQTPRPLPRWLFAGASPANGGIPGMRLVGSPSRDTAAGLEEPYKTLVNATLRKGEYIPIIGVVGTVAILARPRESRIYMIIQNTSVANVLYVGIGFQPTTTAAGSTGLILAANGGNYEPQVFPQGDIWLLGSAANTQFVMYVAQG
jgi:hypothetical protein